MLEHAELRDGLAQSGRTFVEQEYAWQAVEQRMLAALDGDGATQDS
jgi:hypothetical protein